MAEIILSLVIAGLLVFHYISARQWGTEREHLTHLLVAKTPGEVKILERKVLTPRPVELVPEGWSQEEYEGFQGQTGI